jgi:hypothetical protein
MPCQHRGEKEPCIYAKTLYSQVTKETEQISELLGLLRTGSENQALHSLRILRSHDDIGNVLDIIKASRNQRQHPQKRGWGPISIRHLELEYELMTRNAVAFPPLQALESNFIKSVILHRNWAFSDSNRLCCLYAVAWGSNILQGALEHRSFTIDPR